MKTFHLNRLRLFPALIIICSLLGASFSDTYTALIIPAVHIHSSFPLPRINQETLAYFFVTFNTSHHISLILFTIPSHLLLAIGTSTDPLGLYKA
jgi:hypothetical protein